MNLYGKILYIYPDINDEDFELQDDGEGPYVKEWRDSRPRPSKNQINNVSDVDADIASKERFSLKLPKQLKYLFNLENRTRILEGNAEITTEEFINKYNGEV